MLTATPIDAHLPLIIALVLVCAWVVRGTGWSAAVQCAVPLLIAVMMTITDERTRLLAYGIVVASAFGIAAVAVGRQRLTGTSSAELVLTIVGIVLLRWIPLTDVRVLRELIVLAGSIALLFAMPQRRDPSALLWAGTDGPGDGTPAFLIAVLTVAVVTPIRPGKMAFLPFALALLVAGLRGLAVSASRGGRQNEHRATARLRYLATATAAAFLLAAYFARYSLATIYIAAAIVFLIPLLERTRPLAYAAALAVFALWPWSGIIARALPVVRNYDAAGGETRSIARALAASEALAVAVPPHVRHVVVTTSGGQMERLRTSYLVGTIEATDVNGRVTTRQIHIGDMADFGFSRRDQFFASRNPLPRFSPGEIRGYGATTWLWGGGRTAVASAADMVGLRVIAAPDLHPEAHLQIDSVEFPAR